MVSVSGKVVEKKTWSRLFLSVSLGLSLVLSLGVGCSADLWYPMMTSFQKEIPMGFSEQYMLPPNVLLLIDTSGSMTWLPGLAGKDEWGNVIEAANTYGDGSRPLCVKESDGSWRAGNSAVYFGANKVESNDDPSLANAYHPLLTYIDDDLDAMDLDIDDLASVRSVTESVFEDLTYKDSYFARDSEDRYLFPNDSRMYQLKLVLWKIFNDYSLISGLNVGLATYDQEDTYTESTWYIKPPEEASRLSSWNNHQKVSYSGGSNCAALKVDFGSTDDMNHLKELRSWFDGIEVFYYEGEHRTTNDELRAEGSTPLAYSIYDSSRYNEDSACDYFHHIGNDQIIQGYCQDNWLIVLTDGADTTKNGNPETAVQNLYNTTADWTFRVNNENMPIKPVKTMVIGFIDPNSGDDEIQELVDTLNDMADYGDDGELNDSVEEAYFANNVELLLEAFEKIFTKIQEKKGSGNAPLVSPGSRVGSQTTSVYVAPFLPDSDEDGQWEGHLEKYSWVPNASGDLEAPESADWDAGLVLDGTSPSSRVIHTVDWNSTENLIDFHSDNVSVLMSLMFDRTGLIGRREYTGGTHYSDSQWSGFINWVRGADGSGGERWKLGDIYHSGIAEVGPPGGFGTELSYPDFKITEKSRDLLLYVQANDGMLHAFNAQDSTGITGGTERWAFIPPNVLFAGKLIGLKGTFELRKKNLKKWMVFTPLGSGFSMSRYMLDGPILVEDVFDPDEGDSGGWKTVLLAELGYAGAGMYAMDITDPDNPEFLWAVDNAVYRSQGSNNVPEVYLGWESTDGKTLGSAKRRHVCYWGTDANGKVGMEVHPHGEEAFPPDLDYRDLMFTLSVPSVGQLKIPDGNGGSEEKWVALMGNGSYMLMDSASKGAVYAIDILTGKILKTITAVDLPSETLGQVVTPISVLKKDNAQRMEQFYFGDSTGRIFEVKAVPSVGGEDFAWDYREIIRNTQGNGLSYSIELGLDASGHPWVFYATGDLDPKIVPDNGSDYFVACDSLASPDVMLTEDNLTLTDPDVLDSLLVPPSPGWYFPLTGKTVAPPQLYGGYIFYSTFVKNDEDLCKVGGSRLYVMNAFTGEGAWKDADGNHKKYVDLTGVQISGITIKDGKVFVGAIGHEGQGTDNLPAEMQGLSPSFSNNLLVFDVPEVVGEAPQGGGQSSGEMEPRYWREWIHR